MNQQTPRPAIKRKIWIGGAIAAAVVVVAQFGLDGKADEKAVIGTIAPAERYRAPQPVDGMANAPADAAVLAKAGGTESAKDSAKDSAKESAKESVKESAKASAQRDVNGSPVRGGGPILF